MFVQLLKKQNVLCLEEISFKFIWGLILELQLNGGFDSSCMKMFPFGADSNCHYNPELQTLSCYSDLENPLRMEAFSQVGTRSHLVAKPVPVNVCVLMTLIIGC